MKKDIATKWVSALRSGEYKQGSEHLCESGHHCCLGVLCELYIEHTGDLLFSILKQDSEVVSYGGCSEVLPAEVMQWSGMETCTGTLYNDDMTEATNSLAEMNDSGHPFDELADIIEEKWNTL